MVRQAHHRSAQNDRSYAIERIWHMEERRRYKRIIKCFMTWLKFSWWTANPVYPKVWDIVTTHDLGAGGMLFNYDMPIELGTKIHLKVVFPFSRTPIDCIGSVIRSKKVIGDKYSAVYRIAAQFQAISESNKDLIDKVANQICA